MNALLPSGVEFAHPWALLLALVPVVALVWRLRRRERPSLRVPSLAALPARSSLRLRLRFLPTAARVLALLLAVVALARPRERDLVERSTTEGVDIMIALDTSGSMLAEDMTSADGTQQNRFDAAKEVIADFVQRRTSDRIGLLTFDSASVPRSPPTLDTAVFLEFLDQVELDLEGGLTAIGAGLASAVNRLKDSPAKTRVIILVTDGRNTAGRIEPVDAAEIARVLGLRVYTVGVGTKGLAPYPYVGAFGRKEYRRVAADVDDETLQLIADRTNGRYFRATDRDELQGIFGEIDRLEKSVIDVQRQVRWRELFPPFAGAAAVLAVLGIIGSATLWRTFP